VLSGTLDDGTAGLYVIKSRGGATLVQDPLEALYPSMPTSAIRYVEPDYVLPTAELADVLVRLTASANGRPGKEEAVEKSRDPSAEEAQPGELAPFSCPDCGGTLWSAEEDGIETFRCRVGHGFTMRSLVARHREAVDQLIWAGYRALEERAAMSRRVARRLQERGREESARRFERQADVSARQANQMKELLDTLAPAPDPEDAQALW